MTVSNFISGRCTRQAAIGLAVALAPVIVWSQAAGGSKPESVVLADGTPVHLVLMDDLQGKKLQAKEPVHFKVRQDVVVDSKIIVKTGTEAIGHVESVSKSGLFGKSGKLALEIDSANSTSGTKILLRGAAGVNGGKGGALTWESAMWYGPQASLPVGTMLNAYVDHDQKIPVN
jgi:hypothetical protein